MNPLIREGAAEVGGSRETWKNTRSCCRRMQHQTCKGSAAKMSLGYMVSWCRKGVLNTFLAGLFWPWLGNHLDNYCRYLGFISFVTIKLMCVKYSFGILDAELNWEYPNKRLLADWNREVYNSQVLEERLMGPEAGCRQRAAGPEAHAFTRVCRWSALGILG